MTDIKSRLLAYPVGKDWRTGEEFLRPESSQEIVNTVRQAAAYIERLEAANARLKSDRLYVLGCNDGYDAAMDQAAEFCEASESRWREDADKAGEIDHADAPMRSALATAKAETGAFLASVIRGAKAIPLIRGVGLCMLDEDRARNTLKGGNDGKDTTHDAALSEGREGEG